MTEVSRRSFVSASLVAAGGVWLGPAAPITSAAKRIRREAVLGSGTFAHGVSAGAPGQREITLWTHVDGIERSGRVTWEVATDAGFRKVVQRGSARAAQVRDFTARTVVKGLEPGEEYFYRFATKSQSSRVGRFRTARPADSKRARARRLLLLPGLPGGLLHGARRAGAGGPRLRRLPRRLRLRAVVLRRAAARHHRGQRRRRRAEPRGVPRQVPALSQGRAPPGRPRRAPDDRGLGRPRGRGQLGRRPVRRGDAARRAPQRLRSSDAARPTSRSSSGCRATASPTSSRGSTAACRSAAPPSCSCSTRASTATTSRAATSSSSRARTRTRRATMLGAAQKQWLKSTGSRARRRRGRSSARR